ncbi:uncharacterized protein TrAFT101_002186 [Trichoderma asperellum]|uniref:uncharacterized protein n=1 Tax=Trichoderma asperellum TaxID=101201 RepID=UPI00332B9866|nr:hypothetical protein TrAFT101_002186 [Trichoderma asperellum]
MGGVYLHGATVFFSCITDCYCMECVLFFSHFFAFISSLNSKNRFFHSTALDCVLFGVFLSDRELFLQNHPAPLREEKRTKKEVESDSPEGLFFRNGILLESFLYASALLFRSDANIGKWDKLEEIHSPG